MGLPPDGLDLFLGSLGLWTQGFPFLELFSLGNLTLPRKEVWIRLREASTLSWSHFACPAERSAFRSWAFQG